MTGGTDREILQDTDPAHVVPRSTAKRSALQLRGRVGLGLTVAVPLFAIAIALVVASNLATGRRITSSEGASTPTTLIENATRRFPTGGLGMSLNAWEKEHGTANEIGVYPTSDVRYVDGNWRSYYEVHDEGSTDRVFSIEYEIRHVEGEELEAAHAEVRTRALQLLPGDARLVESKPADGAHPATELYESEYLKDLFPRSESLVMWGDAEPGSITLEYRGSPEQVDVYGVYGTEVGVRVTTGDRRVECAIC